MGRTIIDRPSPQFPANALVLDTANAEGIYQLLTSRLAKL
jgi:hypothetical protein